MPAQFTQLFPASASIAQNHFAVGDGNSACRSGREQYLAYLLGSFRREAFLHGFQRCACQVQHRHRLVCTDAVGVEDQGNGNEQERRKQSARNGEHQIVGFRAEHSPAQNTAADERHAQRSNFKKNGDVVARVGHKRSSEKTGATSTCAIHVAGNVTIAYYSAATSLPSSTTALISKNTPKAMRSCRSGTRRMRFAPITAPGMLPAAMAIPAR